MTDGPIDFFLAMERGFTAILARRAGSAMTVEALVDQAYDWFERNVPSGDISQVTADQPTLACEKGCQTCCSLRVTATAPEIFLLATYIRRVEASPQGQALSLSQRVADAYAATRDVGENGRLALAWPCPVLVQGQCLMHPVRTLACRGHAAFSVAQCEAAARGEDVDVAISEAHLTMRGLVQNALQSALRTAGLPWGLYELNQGLALALEDESKCEAWLAGEESLGPAIPDLDMDALGAAFDRLHALH